MTTKYPIILVHGLFMKPRFFRVFKYIQENLKKAGYRVYIADTDGVGTIENNAVQLEGQIGEILKKEGAEKVNIIAHSKGGLESIYLIENMGAGDKVASLTTICTPHRGSAVASWVTGLPSFILYIFVFFCNLFYRILGDKQPDFLTACRQLNSRENSKNTLDCFHGVYCQSYSSTMKNAAADPVLSIPYMISVRYEKDFSDGMVSRSSAKFAEYKGDCIDDSISHNEIVCYLTRRSKKKKVVRFYIELCEDLAKRGY